MAKINEEPDGSWMFEKMTAEELRMYLKFEIELNKSLEEHIAKLDDRSSVIFNLLNIDRSVYESAIKLKKRYDAVRLFDSEMNDKYMDEYMAEP